MSSSRISSAQNDSAPRQVVGIAQRTVVQKEAKKQSGGVPAVIVLIGQLLIVIVLVVIFFLLFQKAAATSIDTLVIRLMKTSSSRTYLNITAPIDSLIRDANMFASPLLAKKLHSAVVGVPNITSLPVAVHNVLNTMIPVNELSPYYAYIYFSMEMGVFDGTLYWIDIGTSSSDGVVEAEIAVMSGNSSTPPEARYYSVNHDTGVDAEPYETVPGNNYADEEYVTAIRAMTPAVNLGQWSGDYFYLAPQEGAVLQSLVTYSVPILFSDKSELDPSITVAERCVLAISIDFNLDSIHDWLVAARQDPRSELALLAKNDMVASGYAIVGLTYSGTSITNDGRVMDFNTTNNTAVNMFFNRIIPYVVSVDSGVPHPDGADVSFFGLAQMFDVDAAKVVVSSLRGEGSRSTLPWILIEYIPLEVYTKTWTTAFRELIIIAVAVMTFFMLISAGITASIIMPLTNIAQRLEIASRLELDLLQNDGVFTILAEASRMQVAFADLIGHLKFALEFVPDSVKPWSGENEPERAPTLSKVNSRTSRSSSQAHGAVDGNRRVMKLTARGGSLSARSSIAAPHHDDKANIGRRQISVAVLLLNEDVALLLGAALGSIRNTATRFRGTVLHLAGGTVFVSFNTHVPCNDSGRNAVSFLGAIRELKLKGLIGSSCVTSWGFYESVGDVGIRQFTVIGGICRCALALALVASELNIPTVTCTRTARSVASIAHCYPVGSMKTSLLEETAAQPMVFAELGSFFFDDEQEWMYALEDNAASKEVSLLNMMWHYFDSDTRCDPELILRDPYLSSIQPRCLNFMRSILTPQEHPMVQIPVISVNVGVPTRNDVLSAVDISPPDSRLGSPTHAVSVPRSFPPL